MAKLKILPRSAEAELTGQVNSPVRPEGRTPAMIENMGRILLIVFRNWRGPAFGAGG